MAAYKGDERPGVFVGPLANRPIAASVPYRTIWIVKGDNGAEQRYVCGGDTWVVVPTIEEVRAQEALLARDDLTIFTFNEAATEKLFAALGLTGQQTVASIIGAIEALRDQRDELLKRPAPV